MSPPAPSLKVSARRNSDTCHKRPLQNDLATIRVSETGAGACRVDWTARFDLPDGVPAEAVAPALEKAYGGSLKALKKLLEGG